MNPRICCLVVVFSAIASPKALAQTTLQVPSQYATIQGAINAASTGDTILVAPGIYVETIDYLGKEIVVRSVAGAPATVIDGNQQGSVVSIVNDEGPGAVLDGFTITNGTGTMDLFGAHGGGVLCINSSPLVAHCIITGNIATATGFFGGGNSVGGGIACLINPLSVPAVSPSPTIRDCIVSANIGENGAGIGCQDTSPHVESCVISNNTSLGGFTGGGGMAFIGSRGSISSSIICSNSALQGGGVWISYSGASMTNCVVHANNAVNRGGGVSLVSVFVGPSGFLSASRIVNSTISSNTVSTTQAGSSVGGGLDASGAPTGPSTLISNTIIWGNTANDVSAGNNVVFESCDIAGGWGGAGTGNIDADPLFVDPAAGDFHLSAGSPCIDAGDATVAGLPARDIDGDLRVLYGSVDIGYDEWLAPCFSGTTGNPSAPEGVVTINGSAGPFVSAAPGEFLILTVGQPSTNANPADFVLWLAPGVPPLPSTVLPWGTLCLAPSGQILASSFPALPGAIPATPTPWSRSTSGIPFPVTLTVQGLIVDDDTVTNNVAVTNGVVLVVE